MRIHTGKVTGTFPSSPFSCVTLSSTGATATLSVSWSGTVNGARAAFSPSTVVNSRSQLVTDSSGHEGFSIPGNGNSSASGSFAAASAASSANVFTTRTRTALASMCHSPRGISKLVVSGTVTVGSAAGVSGTYSVPIGDYAGYSNPGGVGQFGLATGTNPTFATDYLDRIDGWASMDSATGVWGWSGTGYRLVLAVPILPGVGTLAQGATGAYNQYFSTLAHNLVADGQANAILRLGWEFNGTWYPWSVSNNTDAQNFAAFWRQIVNTMRAVPGEQFEFLWNTNAASPTSFTPSLAYPGDGYVDYVGTDLFDNFWGTPFTPAAGWANQLSEPWGLNWLASFAALHNKPIAIPEWSAEYRTDGAGFGDDPSFMDHMAAWFVANKVAFANVWSYDTSATNRDNILDGTFPHALAEFKIDFG